MLVVVSIILLVAVVALPGISSLSKSASRRSSVSLVMTALDQARAMAVGQSANTYFVFANGDPQFVLTESNGKSTSDYRYRAFAVFQEVYIPPQANASPTALAEPYQLVPVRQWTLLPEGVAFRPDAAPKEGDSTPTERTIFSAQPLLAQKFYCQPAKADLEKLPYVRFNATGAIDDPTTAEFARIKIFEGFVDTNGTAVTTNAAKAMADETIVLSLFTGRAKRQEATNAAN